MTVEKKTTNKRVLTTKEAAEYLGVISHRTLEKWRKLSKPKGPRWVNNEGIIGYRLSDLEAYEESNIKIPGDDFAA